MADDLSGGSSDSEAAPFSDSDGVSSVEAMFVRPVMRREVVAVAL